MPQTMPQHKTTVRECLGVTERCPVSNVLLEEQHDWDMTLGEGKLQKQMARICTELELWYGPCRGSPIGEKAGPPG